MKLSQILVASLTVSIISQSAFARGTAPSVNDKALEDIGNVLQFAIPLSAFVYSTSIHDYDGNWQLAKTLGSTYVTTEVLKSTVKADRPQEPDGTKGKSFPSGHTSFSFAGAGYWQNRYGWWVGAPMYALAGVVGVSRVKAKKHNWADVAGGAVIGTAFSYIFTSKYNNERTNVYIEPTDGGAYLGFSTKF